MPQITILECATSWSNRNDSAIFGIKRKFVSLLVIGMCVLAFGCKGSQRIWYAEAKSPDGNMLASAQTVTQSGFGTGYIGTIVYLTGVKSLQPRMEILGLSGGTEVPGATRVGMKWLSPTHLELTYKYPLTLDFQAVKCYGVEITVHAFSADTTTFPSR